MRLCNFTVHSVAIAALCGFWMAAVLLPTHSIGASADIRPQRPLRLVAPAPAVMAGVKARFAGQGAFVSPPGPRQYVEFMRKEMNK